MRRVLTEQIKRLLETADSITGAVVTNFGIRNDQVQEISDTYDTCLKMLYKLMFGEDRLFYTIPSVPTVREINPDILLVASLRTFLKETERELWALSKYETSVYCDIRDYKFIASHRVGNLAPANEPVAMLADDTTLLLVDFTIKGPNGMVREYRAELGSLNITNSTGVPIRRAHLTESDAINRLNELLFDNSGFMTVEKATVVEFEITTERRVLPFEH